MWKVKARAVPMEPLGLGLPKMGRGLQQIPGRMLGSVWMQKRAGLGTAEASGGGTGTEAER